MPTAKSDLTRADPASDFGSGGDDGDLPRVGFLQKTKIGARADESLAGVSGRGWLVLSGGVQLEMAGVYAATMAVVTCRDVSDGGSGYGMTGSELQILSALAGQEIVSSELQMS